MPVHIAELILPKRLFPDAEATHDPSRREIKLNDKNDVSFSRNPDVTLFLKHDSKLFLECQAVIGRACCHDQETIDAKAVIEISAPSIQPVRHA